MKNQDQKCRIQTNDYILNCLLTNNSQQLQIHLTITVFANTIYQKILQQSNLPKNIKQFCVDLKELFMSIKCSNQINLTNHTLTMIKYKRFRQKKCIDKELTIQLQEQKSYQNIVGLKNQTYDLKINSSELGNIMACGPFPQGNYDFFTQEDIQYNPIQGVQKSISGFVEQFSQKQVNKIYDEVDEQCQIYNKKPLYIKQKVIVDIEEGFQHFTQQQNTNIFCCNKKFSKKQDTNTCRLILKYQMSLGKNKTFAIKILKLTSSMTIGIIIKRHNVIQNQITYNSQSGEIGDTGGFLKQAIKYGKDDEIGFVYVQSQGLLIWVVQRRYYVYKIYGNTYELSLLPFIEMNADGGKIQFFHH